MEGPLAEFQASLLCSHKRSPGFFASHHGLVEPVKVRRVGSSESVHDLGRSLHRLVLPNTSETHDDARMGEPNNAGAGPAHPPPETATLTHHPSATSIPVFATEETFGSVHCDAPSGAEPSAVFAGHSAEEEEVDREPGLPQDMEGFDAGPGPSALFASEAVSSSRSGREEPAMWFWHGGSEGARTMDDGPPSGAASLCEQEETLIRNSLNVVQDEDACARLARREGASGGGCEGAGAGAGRDLGTSRKRNASQAHEAARAAWEAAAGARAMARQIVQRCTQPPPPLQPLSRLSNPYTPVSERRLCQCTPSPASSASQPCAAPSCVRKASWGHVDESSSGGDMGMMEDGACMPEPGECDGGGTLGGGMEDD